MFAVENIAEGFAGASIAARSDRFISATLKRIGGDREICCKLYHINEDEDGIPISGGCEWQTVFISDFLGMNRTLWNTKTRQYEADDFSYVKDYDDFCELVRDLWECGRIMSRKEMEQEISDQKRKNLETIAADFARKCGYKVGSREYILAAKNAIQAVRYERNRWNDAEVRAEQWAACGGREVYFDDLNFENSRYDSRIASLSDVLNWLEENCPLLMRQMEE